MKKSQHLKISSIGPKRLRILFVCQFILLYIFGTYLSTSQWKCKCQRFSITDFFYWYCRHACMCKDVLSSYTFISSFFSLLSIFVFLTPNINDPFFETNVVNLWITWTIFSVTLIGAQMHTHFNSHTLIFLLQNSMLTS